MLLIIGEENLDHLLPTKVESNFCETEDFCVIPNGSIVSFTLGFTSGKTSDHNL